MSMNIIVHFSVNTGNILVRLNTESCITVIQRELYYSYIHLKKKSYLSELLKFLGIESYCKKANKLQTTKFQQKFRFLCLH